MTTHKQTPITPPAITGEPSRTDQKVDHTHSLVRDMLAPRIQTMSANAVLTDRREFYHYQMKRTGRRCSCYTVENSPSKQCPICYGVGIVGGYEKFGTLSEILDVTSPNLRLVNVTPTLDSDSRPVFLQLETGFDNGYIEATLPIRQNIGLIDTYLLHQPLFNRGAKIRAYDPMGADAYITKSEDWEPFLAFPTVRVRIELTRIDPKAIVSHLLLRYKTREELIVFGDIPRSEENLSSTQFGFIDAYSELTVFFDGKVITKFDNEDLLYRLSDARRFKIVRVNPNLVASILTSTDVVARYLIPSVDIGITQVLV